MMKTPPFGGTTSRLTAADASDSVVAVMYIPHGTCTVTDTMICYRTTEDRDAQAM